MDTYRTLLESSERSGQFNVAPPQFRILWPTQMGLSPRDYGLPDGAKLTIVDLPGLKYVGDNNNGQVMQEQARKAFCIIAYNSLETDPRKQEALLGEVVDQVKELGGSPARMLFVLNKIDVFRTEHDPKAKEDHFTHRITGQIRNRVSEALPDYAEVAHGITPIGLSSEPALFAMKARNVQPGEAIPILKDLQTHYAAMFRGDAFDDLPRRPEYWSDAQRRWLLDEALQQSRFPTFRSTLATHISNNLPEMLLPELVQPASQAAYATLKDIDALREAYQLGSKAAAIKATKNLEELYQRIQHQQKEAMGVLDPFHRLQRVDAENPSCAENIRSACEDIKNNIQSFTGISDYKVLDGLWLAVDDITADPIHRLFAHVDQRMRGEIETDQVIEATRAAGPLYHAIDALRAGLYGRSFQQERIRFEAAETNQVRQALADFARALTDVTTSLIAREATIQGERLKAMLEACVDTLVDTLEQKLLLDLETAGFPGLSGVFRGEFNISTPKLPPTTFEPDISKWRETHTETILETRRVNRRSWRRLWLWRSEVEETYPVEKKTERDGIEVSGLRGILQGFANGMETSKMDDAMSAWLGDTLQELDRSLSQRLEAGVTTYRQTFLLRKEEIARGTQESLIIATTVETEVRRAKDAIREAYRPIEDDMADVVVGLGAS
jgi:hypothetical protein